MKVSTSLTDRHSEDDFAAKLSILLDAGAGVIQVRSQEVVRATLATRKALLIEGNIYHEWDTASGFKKYTIGTMYDKDIAVDNNVVIHEALAVPFNAVDEVKDDENFTVYSFVNPQYWLENNPVTTHYLQQYCHGLAATNIRVILITPDIPLPSELSDTIVTLQFDSPSHTELREYLDSVLVDVDSSILSLEDEEKDRLCYAGAGMSRENFETYVSLSIVEASADEDVDISFDTIMDGLSSGKTEIVNKNDILELYPSESMEDVGGMENLKEWVAKRADCYSDEAKEFGIEPPKGMVCVGIPGTGKSLAAKSIAREFGVPLVRLDFGRVFNSLVGSSEERMRTALRMVESMAPVVLLCDEIDKGLGGIGGSGDSGTSSRVLGSFLTWLQDSIAPVFTMVTANNVAGLPPELLRRGRFDAIFSTGFPTVPERMEILAIHLRKRGYNAKDFPRKDRLKVCERAKGYVPAEIEAAVKDGLIDAFSAGEEFSMRHVFEALVVMVPLSKSYAEVIQIMTLWMKNNATPASKEYVEDITEEDKVTPINKRRQRRIRIKDDKDKGGE